mgnify:CR=1 FL=1
MVETMKKIISFLCVGLLGGCFSLGYFYYQSQTADFQIKDIQGNRDVLKNMETLNRLPFKARKAVFEKLEKIIDSHH